MGGWAAQEFLFPCGSLDPTRYNRVGIGAVDQGNQGEVNFARGLGGERGWLLLVFAGVSNTSTGAEPSWVQAVQEAYAQNLSVAIRLSPPWGQSHYRDEADDAPTSHKNYTTLARAFSAVVRDLVAAKPTTDEGWPMLLQLDNEPNLGYEWFCQVAGSPLPFQEVAAEYASFFKQAATAVHNLGRPDVLVGPAGLAPGGIVTYGCCGAENCPGDKPGVTGLQFQTAMIQAVPDVYNHADLHFSHAYPASGVGFGFNVPYSQAGPGLNYFQQELSLIEQQAGRVLQAFVSETGWATHRQGLPSCSEQDKATWTQQAYEQVWGTSPRVLGVTPFMLQGPVWGDQDGYGYVAVSGATYPVYAAVQNVRRGWGFSD